MNKSAITHSHTEAEAAIQGATFSGRLIHTPFAMPTEAIWDYMSWPTRQHVKPTFTSEDNCLPSEAQPPLGHRCERYIMDGEQCKHLKCILMTCVCICAAETKVQQRKVI